MMYRTNSRRNLLRAGALSAAALCAAPVLAQRITISPGEDLMQEHGLVGRVIYIYRRAIERLEAGERIDGGHVAEAARIVSRVIHGHHEQEEERIVFPSIERNPDLRRLTSVLRGQHGVARTLTARIGLEIIAPDRQQQLLEPMTQFIEMYEPHGAYENTVIYPAFREAVGPERYAELAREWARDERSLAGNFRGYTEKLDLIDRAMGIDLAQATAVPPSPRRS